MRAYEFLNENATAAATSSGNVATVVMPLKQKGKLSFFGHPMEEMPEYGDTKPLILRRPSLLTKNKKKG